MASPVVRRAPTDSQPLPDIRTRNLLYHVYGVPSHPVWVANLRQIKQRWSLFNGRRIVAVAVEPGTIRASDVRAILGEDAEYLEIRNDRRLRERATFVPMLTIIRSHNPHEATFYAHAKGTTPFRQAKEEEPEGIVYWRNSMYHRCLDDWSVVHAGLRNYPMVGTLKLNWAGWSAGTVAWNYYPTGLYCGHWMYAGTYFWFRHDLTFSNPRAMHPACDNYGVESWPGRLWAPEYGCSIHQPWDEHQPNPNLYQAATHDPKQGWDRISDA